LTQSIGLRIRQLRKERNLRQSDFVGPNISNGYLSLIEKGLRNPSPKALERIAEVLGVHISEIVGFTRRSLGVSERAELELLTSMVSLGDLDQFDSRVSDLSSELRQSLALQLLQARVEAERGNILSAFSTLERLAMRDIAQEDPSDVWEFVNALSTYSTLIGNQWEAVHRLGAILDATNRTEKSNLYVLICCAYAAKLSELGEHGSAFRILYDARNAAQKPLADFTQARLLWSEAASQFNKGEYLSALSLSERARGYLDNETDPAPKNRLTNLMLNCLIYSTEVSNQELLAGLEIIDTNLKKLATVSPKSAQIVALEIQKVELLAKLDRPKDALALATKILDGNDVAPVDLPLLHLLICEQKVAINPNSFDRQDLATSINAISQLAPTAYLKLLGERQINLALLWRETELALQAFSWYSKRNSFGKNITNVFSK